MWWMSRAVTIFTIRQLCEEFAADCRFYCGRSPALRSGYEKKLEKQFGPEYAEW